MAGQEPHYDIFLVHAAGDKETARALYAALRAADLRVFFDEESLIPGDRFMREIPSALASSQLIAVLISAAVSTHGQHHPSISRPQAGDINGGRK